MESSYLAAMEELHLHRTIFRSVISGICIVDARLHDMPVTYVNPAFEAMTGYTHAEMLGKNCRILQGPDTDQPCLPAIRDAIARRHEVIAVIKNYRKDGTPFWNELSLSPIRDTGGEVTHFVGIQSDVTSRVDFEAALRESEKLAVVGRLASSIAHEINNPLESVMNLIYLARGSGTDGEKETYLALADQELRRVKLITAKSLRFYKQTTLAQAADATAILLSVLDVYRSQLVNATVTLDLRTRSTRSINCMDSEVRQVLSNLISNAIDSMRASGGRLVLRTRNATCWHTGEPGILVTVADTGSGMDPETMRSIYKAFFTTKGIAGTGLGLWISAEIVQRHGGRLTLRSTQKSKASGTVFQLFLPCHGLAAKPAVTQPSTPISAMRVFTTCIAISSFEAPTSMATV